jgi:hypothetical protein
MTFRFDSDATAAIIVNTGQNSSVRITCHWDYLRYVARRDITVLAARRHPQRVTSIIIHQPPRLMAIWWFWRISDRDGGKWFSPHHDHESDRRAE